ncbi:LacI family DNA-binding transcriptional regulator [Galbitalea sp. SE-J8]|uniref:LacI family DNA-binding transcriptional regulator n=1 Tax=Galbitalea sp. SE-J8 TaxID=3054952 RepID=UPI00259CF8B2|nr:LacI family DNA-binding transcriptional regulator [Galbitalea sp. SE-J8]MDM4762062.1 LacI family DNA-binding transcriptional regulator [Galbitalea sp. SE-J8]
MARSERPTMVDVAADAGVSLKTVSRVINLVPTVDPALAERVQASMERLGFRRNMVAANLRAGKSDLIGLVTADLSNAFYTTIASGVSRVAVENGYQVMMASSEESADTERTLALDLCQRRAGGLLVVPTRADHAYLAAEIRLGTPVVFIDRPAEGLEADAVLIDNRGGAAAAIADLVARGHRRIGLLLDALAIFTMTERLEGARAAFAEAGLEADIIVTDLHRPAQAAEAASALLASADPPTALFCANNRITVGAVEAILRAGSAVDVAGFDDFEVSHLLPFEVLIVDYDTRALGERAAELLLRRMDGDDSPLERVLLPTELVRRGGALV